jgi:hypothetical protein
MGKTKSFCARMSTLKKCLFLINTARMRRPICFKLLACATIYDKKVSEWYISLHVGYLLFAICHAYSELRQY